MTKNNTNQYGLTDRDMRTLLVALDKYPQIDEVHLFGSRAKGNFKTGSDIDLAVMNKGVSAKIINALKAYFSDSSLPYQVDLVNFTELANPEFIDHIKRVGVLFYKRLENSSLSHSLKKQ